MGIAVFANIAKAEYQNSRNIIESLKKVHLDQYIEHNISRKELTKLKNISRKKRWNVM